VIEGPSTAELAVPPVGTIACQLTGTTAGVCTLSEPNQTPQTTTLGWPDIIFLPVVVTAGQGRLGGSPGAGPTGAAATGSATGSATGTDNLATVSGTGSAPSETSTNAGATPTGAAGRTGASLMTATLSSWLVIALFAVVGW